MIYLMIFNLPLGLQEGTFAGQSHAVVAKLNARPEGQNISVAFPSRHIMYSPQLPEGDWK